MRRITAALLASAMFTGTGWAQEDRGAWVQIEALPTLAEGQTRAAAYAQFLPDVTGWALSSGWYAIALGPYAESGARDYTAALKASRSIPSDSYLTDGSSYQTQFWPVGVGAQTTAQPLPPQPETIIETQPLSALPDETPREAERSESALNRAERQDLQRALHWAGAYEGKIDGAFGRGTRSAMSDWQEKQGFEKTGILTTRQRAELMQAFNAPLESLGLEPLRDSRAGIEVELPLGLVSFQSYEPPFARYASEDGQIEVLLLSQAGDAARLSGIYEILQSLPEIPDNGPRSANASGFTLHGTDARYESYAEAKLSQGQIKGFVIRFPSGDSERLARLKTRMSESFTPIDGVLPDAGSEQRSLEPLDVRLPAPNRLKPTEVQSGFYVSQTGHIVTAAEPLAGCRSLLIDGEYPASVVKEAKGALLLEPEVAIAPRAIAPIASVATQNIQIAVSGYPFATQLSSPALTFGTLESSGGLSGTEADKLLLDLAASKGDIGGPILDETGAVVALLLPRQTYGKVMAETAQEALNLSALQELLSGLPLQAGGNAPLTPARLVRLSSNYTAQITCN